MNAEDLDCLHNELEKSGLSKERLAEMLKEIKSIFVGEDDFGSSLELFLNIRIREVKS